ncbi:tRNA endonuclease ANKZF1-like [Diadema antillarum]|uniref:tRNA endonuclease ANKZF1-like n=1 Tax=Diadema antillarum TaxID=105358 RepID=UPI003A8531A4
MEKHKHESSCLLTDKGKAWKFFAGIKLSSLQPNVVSEDFFDEPAKPDVTVKEEPEVYTVSAAMLCSLCDIKFEMREQQKEHYRVDWHRFNLKRRMMGLKTLSEDAFAQLGDDISSISGSGDSSSEDDVDMSPVSHHHSNHTLGTSSSLMMASSHLSRNDSDDDEDEDDANSEKKSSANGRRHPRIYFENEDGQVVSIYRCIVHGKRDSPSSHSELISRGLGLLSNRKWAIMMTGGGHFAAAVYDGCDVVVHKTFHRYTVRAKRGTVQSVRDSKGNAPKSLGASLRRYNEAALNQEVQDLLASWKTHLDACHRIFLRVPTYNKAMFFGGKNPALEKRDLRVVTIPFATRRATFKELQRVWEQLATIKCHGSKADVEKRFSSPDKKAEWKKASKGPKGQADPAEDAETMETILVSLEKNSLSDQNNLGISEGLEKDEEENDEEKDVEFILEDATSTTDHLRGHEVSQPKPQRRKKKKKQLSKQHNEDVEETSLTSDLFTICRTGNMDKLNQVLNKIREKYLSRPGPPNQDNGNSGNDDSTQTTPWESDASSPKDDGVSSSLPAPSEQGQESHDIGETGSCSDNQQSLKSEMCSRTGEESGEFNTNTECDSSSLRTNSAQCNSQCNTESKSASKTCEGHTPLREEPDTGDSSHQCSETEEGSKDKAEDSEGNYNQQHQPDEAAQDLGVECRGEEPQKSTEGHDTSRSCKKFYKFLNKQLDNLGYTFLHVAAEDGQTDVMYHLMEAGADPGVKNKKGKPPYGCSLDKKTRDTFRKFRASYPDRYDYERAQIPAPLSEDQEREKAAKQSERKKNKRKAKREREKEDKKEQEAQRKEEEKQQWYAALSDREKRALAAEKRFAMQTTSTSELQRCWSCGSSLTGKVPFSYMDFKFCSMPCLKRHKRQAGRPAS